MAESLLQSALSRGLRCCGESSSAVILPSFGGGHLSPPVRGQRRLTVQFGFPNSFPFPRRAKLPPRGDKQRTRLRREVGYPHVSDDAAPWVTGRWQDSWEPLQLGSWKAVTMPGPGASIEFMASVIPRQLAPRPSTLLTRQLSAKT